MGAAIVHDVISDRICRMTIVGPPMCSRVSGPLGRYAAQKDHFLRIDLEDFHVSTNAYFPPNGQLTDLMYIPLQFIHFLWMRFTLYANEVERDWFLLGAKKS